MFSSKIVGIGKYIPEKVLTNHDLEKIVETSDDWITQRTGIKERHIAAPDESTSVLAAKAAEKAIAMSGIDRESIEMVILCTFTPDMLMPASACIAQDILKIPNAGTVDIEAACSGFIYGLSMAHAYIASGMMKNVLVIGSETISRFVDWQDRGTCVLFGDGAGAAVVSRTDEKDVSGFIGFKLFGDGAYKDLLAIPAGGALLHANDNTIANRLHYLKMNGNTTFKLAVRTMASTLESLLQEHNLKGEDVKLLVPHQANMRIITSVAERLCFPMEKVMVNLDKYANTSAATIPIALEEAQAEGRIKKGDLVALVAFGGGFTAGASLMRW